MSRRVNASLSEAEIAALEAHPEFAGSLGGLLRILALRAAGYEPADPYADHRARPRDTKGRIMPRKFFADIEDAAKASLNLPAGITHMVTGHAHGDHFIRVGFSSLEQAKQFAADWRDPAKHELRRPPGGVIDIKPRHDIYGGRELQPGPGEGEYLLTYPDREPVPSYR